VAAADPLEHCAGFDWDDANTNKNWERHGVSPEEAEDVFFREPLIVRSDIRHSKTEKRYYSLGHTSAGRRLFGITSVNWSVAARGGNVERFDWK